MHHTLGRGRGCYGSNGPRLRLPRSAVTTTALAGDGVRARTGPGQGHCGLDECTFLLGKSFRFDPMRLFLDDRFALFFAGLLLGVLLRFVASTTTTTGIAAAATVTVCTFGG